MTWTLTKTITLPQINAFSSLISDLAVDSNNQYLFFCDQLSSTSGARGLKSLSWTDINASGATFNPTAGQVSLTDQNDSYQITRCRIIGSKIYYISEQGVLKACDLDGNNKVTLADLGTIYGIAGQWRNITNHGNTLYIYSQSATTNPILSYNIISNTSKKEVYYGNARTGFNTSLNSPDLFFFDTTLSNGVILLRYNLLDGKFYVLAGTRLAGEATGNALTQFTSVTARYVAGNSTTQYFIVQNSGAKLLKLEGGAVSQVAALPAGTQSGPIWINNAMNKIVCAVNGSRVIYIYDDI